MKPSSQQRFGDVRSAAQEWKRGTFSPRVLTRMIRAMGVPWMLTLREYKPMVAYIAQVIGWSELDVWDAIRIAGEHDFTKSTLGISHIQKLANETKMNSKRELELQLLLAWCAQDSGRFQLTRGYSETHPDWSPTREGWSVWFSQYSLTGNLTIVHRNNLDEGIILPAFGLKGTPVLESQCQDFNLKRGARVHRLLGKGLEKTSLHMLMWAFSRNYFDTYPELPNLADPGITPF